jgi:NADP-dependent 3-hydroxy acid dehydrogenase YdfG
VANPAQVVVVTGASAGIGRAVAVAFGSRGASVGLIARGRAGLEGARREIEAAGGRAVVIPTDVADQAAVERAAAAVEDEFGPIDVWVNDAMASVMGGATEVDPAEFRRVTEVTYLGTVWGTLAALRRMVPRDRGVIVQVGSAVSYRAIPLQSAYSGAKFAARGFTDAVRTELAHDGSDVRITMVQLPAVNTPQFDWVRSHLRFRAQPLPPVFEPDVAAAAVLRAVDRPRRELFVGGRATAGAIATLIAPGFMDRFLGRTAISGQQTDEPEDPTRADNLWHPLDDTSDRGARGRFGAQAHERSVQLWANTHRAATTAGALAVAGIVAAVVRMRRG